MPVIDISGIPVEYPFEPYDVQRKYMEKVIECLNNRTNAALESPTGTGKTLCLICATLAWIQHKIAENKRIIFVPENATELPQKIHTRIPKVIYATRTHSQVAQAIQELKETKYNFMRATVLGSRDKLCIHEELTNCSSERKVNLCVAKKCTSKCDFFKNFKKLHAELALPLEARTIDLTVFEKESVLDIEDLVNAGKELNCCPYYVTREMLFDKAEIVFMPYNYLFDRKVMDNDKLENAIIIVDEAHNLPQVCEESASVRITSKDIHSADGDVENARMLLASDDEHAIRAEALLKNEESMQSAPEFSIDSVSWLSDTIKSLAEVVRKIKIPHIGKTFNGGFAFEILRQAGIDRTNGHKMGELLGACTKYLAIYADISDTALAREFGMYKLWKLVETIFQSSADDSGDRFSSAFKIHIEPEQNNFVGSKVLDFWCFSASVAMQSLIRGHVRNIILTSGTLAPLRPFINELDIPIDVRLANPHIVGNSQVFAKVILYGNGGVQLKGNFENRNDEGYVKSLGNTISKLCQDIPDGVLVFFPSYKLLNNLKFEWQKRRVENGRPLPSIWSSIADQKRIFIEPQKPQTKEEFKNTMDEYYATINDPQSNGAVFMGICRGKVAEGLNFADKYARAVLIVSLPYPPKNNTKVKLKMEYVDRCSSYENRMHTGEDWYNLEASRAVNQAIGRVIRHRNDYGAILLCDSRFCNSGQESRLSGWVQTHLKNSSTHRSFDATSGELRMFFEKAIRMFPETPKPTVTDESSPNTLKIEENVPVDNHANAVVHFGSAEPEGINTDNNAASTSSSLVNLHSRNRRSLNATSNDASTPKKMNMSL